MKRLKKSLLILGLMTLPLLTFAQTGGPGEPGAPCDPDEPGCEIQDCGNGYGEPCNTPLDTWVWVLVLVSGLYTVIYMTRDKTPPPTPELSPEQTRKRKD